MPDVPSEDSDLTTRSYVLMIKNSRICHLEFVSIIYKWKTWVKCTYSVLRLHQAQLFYKKKIPMQQKFQRVLPTASTPFSVISKQDAKIFSLGFHKEDKDRIFVEYIHGHTIYNKLKYNIIIRATSEEEPTVERLKTRNSRLT